MQSLASLVFAISAASCSAGLIGFADVGHGSLNSPLRKRYTTGPTSARATVASLGEYAIAKLDSAGMVLSTTESLRFSDDAIMPGCNAAFSESKGLYYKTTVRVSSFVPSNSCGTCPTQSVCCKDPTQPEDKGMECFAVANCSDISAGSGQGGDILTIDASSGKIIHNVSMKGDVVHPVFGAVDESSGLVYSMVPYSYTEFGLFSFNPLSGAVKMVKSWTKAQTDGIGLCDGRVYEGGKLIYQMGSNKDHLMVVDLKTLKVVGSLLGFYGPLVTDPIHKDKLLAIQNVEKHGVNLVWLDPLNNSSQLVFILANTTLGQDLRAQDQSSMAIDPSGTTVWFIASYNDPKSGQLYRGAYTVEISKDRSTGSLKSEKVAFGDASGKWLGKLDYAGGSSTRVAVLV